MLKISFQNQNLRKWPCYFSFIFRYKMLFSLTMHNVKCIVILEVEILSAFASIPLSISILWTNSQQISYINKCGIRGTHNIGLLFTTLFHQDPDPLEHPWDRKKLSSSHLWAGSILLHRFCQLGALCFQDLMEEGICTLSPNRLGAGSLPCFPISRELFLLWSRWTFTHKTR